MSKLDEKDFIYLSEFREYLEHGDSGKKSGLAPKTIKRHVINVIDFLYYASTHNYEVEIGGPDEVPVDDLLITRGDEFFTLYFISWMSRCGYSEESAKQSIVSVKKFYKFLKETGRIDKNIADAAIEDLSATAFCL